MPSWLAVSARQRQQLNLVKRSFSYLTISNIRLTIGKETAFRDMIEEEVEDDYLRLTFCHLMNWACSNIVPQNWKIVVENGMQILVPKNEKNTNILPGHSNQNSLFFFQILGYFATISRTGTDPFSKYLDFATTSCGITRFRFHSSRVSQIAKTTSYAARSSNVAIWVPRSAFSATIWSSSDRFLKLLRDFFDNRVALICGILVFRNATAPNQTISQQNCCEILRFRNSFVARYCYFDFKLIARYMNFENHGRECYLNIILIHYPTCL